MKKSRANLLLFLVAVIWGGGFLFAKVALESGFDAGTVSMFRGLFLMVISFIIFFRHIIKINLRDVVVGLIAGGTNAAGFILQTYGQSLTTTSHASLLTVVYVVFVPIVLWIFYGIRPRLKTVFALILCVLGTLFLTNMLRESEGSSLVGDLIVLAGAVVFGVNMAYLGQSGRESHYGVVAFFMGAVMFVASLIFSFATGGPHFPSAADPVALRRGIISIIYIGLFSTALCQILQVLCQRYTSPVSASVILTLEGLFGSILALIFGFDEFSVNLVVGGLLLTAGVFVQVSEINWKKLFAKRRKKEEKEE